MSGYIANMGSNLNHTYLSKKKKTETPRLSNTDLFSVLYQINNSANTINTNGNTTTLQQS